MVACSQLVLGNDWTPAVFAVFDGHGTDHVSSFLEKNTSSYLQKSFATSSASPMNFEIEAALHSTFQQLHDDVCKEDKNDSLGGSTACLVIVDNTRIVCSNVGDSRAILVKSDSRFKPLSVDQKPDRPDEKQRIEDQGGVILFSHCELRVAGVLAMSRAIGDGWMTKYGVSSQPEITIHPRSSEDDYVICASDGVWGALSSEEAAMIVSKVMMRLMERGVGRERSLNIAAKFLCKTAMTRGSCDNISAIIIDVNPDQAASTQTLPAAGTQLCETSAAAPPSLPSPPTITTSSVGCPVRSFATSLANLRPTITTNGGDTTQSRNQNQNKPFVSSTPRHSFSPFTSIRSILSERSDSLPIDLTA